MQEHLSTFIGLNLSLDEMLVELKQSLKRKNQIEYYDSIYTRFYSYPDNSKNYKEEDIVIPGIRSTIKMLFYFIIFYFSFNHS